MRPATEVVQPKVLSQADGPQGTIFKAGIRMATLLCGPFTEKGQGAKAAFKGYTRRVGGSCRAGFMSGMAKQKRAASSLSRGASGQAVSDWSDFHTGAGPDGVLSVRGMSGAPAISDCVSTSSPPDWGRDCSGCGERHGRYAPAFWKNAAGSVMLPGSFVSQHRARQINNLNYAHAGVVS